MADLEFGVRVNGVSSAVTDVGRVAQANEAVGRAARTAGTATTSSANAARSAFAGLGQVATQTGQRVGQMGSAVGQMASAFSSLTPVLGRSGGVLSQLGGTVGALTGAMGPLGLALGAVTVAASAAGQAFAAQDAAMDSARDHARSLTRSLQDLIAVQRQQREDAALTERLSQGGGTADEQRAFAQQAANRRQLIQAAMSGDSGALAELRSSGQLASTRTELTLMERLTGGRLGQGEVGEGAGETAQLTQMLERAFEEERVRTSIANEQQIEELGQRLRTLTEGPSPTSAPVRRGGGGGGRSRAAAGDDEADFTREMAALTRELAAAEAERTQALLAHKSKIEEVQAAEMEAARAAMELEREHTAEMLDAARQRADAQRELAQSAAEAAGVFRDSWRGGIDDVIASWQAANVALAESGQEQLSTARLLEEGMHSTANTIADAVGGTLVSAFQVAVDAWLDGSLTFVEAAEQMTKGVLKALVSEAIVQGVVELARAVASAASYDMAGAALHLGAAAAWAAVGAAAGAVGVGIGAFGGGASKGGAAAGAAMPQASAQDSQRPAGNTVINVYPGGFVTRGEVVAGIYEAINEGGRMGMQFDGAAVGA